MQYAIFQLETEQIPAAAYHLECQNCKTRNLERSKPISDLVILSSLFKLEEKLVTGEKAVSGILNVVGVGAEPARPRQKMISSL